MAAAGARRERGVRANGILILLGLGAAFLAVIFLHKLREKRLYNLLIKDKDKDLIDLYLLLQKERDVSKEVKRKFEEMEATTDTLRIQNAELGNKLRGMQYTTVSLRDKVKSLESDLEEKDDKIRTFLQKEMDPPKQDLQINYLKELLKQREAYIEELKQRPHKLSNVLSSRSTDDPSNAALNLTGTKENAAWPPDGGQLGKNVNSQGSEGNDKKEEELKGGEDENMLMRGESGDKNVIQYNSGDLRSHNLEESQLIEGLGRGGNGSTDVNKGESGAVSFKETRSVTENSFINIGAELIKRDVSSDATVREGRQEVFSKYRDDEVSLDSTDGLHKQSAARNDAGLRKRGKRVHKNKAKNYKGEEELGETEHSQGGLRTKKKRSLGYQNRKKSDMQRMGSRNVEFKRMEASHDEVSSKNIAEEKIDGNQSQGKEKAAVSRNETEVEKQKEKGLGRTEGNMLDDRENVTLHNNDRKVEMPDNYSQRENLTREMESNKKNEEGSSGGGSISRDLESDHARMYKYDDEGLRKQEEAGSMQLDMSRSTSTHNAEVLGMTQGKVGQDKYKEQETAVPSDGGEMEEDVANWKRGGVAEKQLESSEISDDHAHDEDYILSEPGMVSDSDDINKNLDI